MNKIINIIPADNWWAVYNDKGTLLAGEIACFALVEAEDGLRVVEPMDGYGEIIDFATDVSNFVGQVRADNEEEALSIARKAFN